MAHWALLTVLEFEPFPQFRNRIWKSHAANISIGSAICVEITFFWVLGSLKVADALRSTEKKAIKRGRVGSRFDLGKLRR